MRRLVVAGAFNAAALGRWTADRSFTVTADRIAAYAEATNDPIQAHRLGEVAPPVFAVVPAFNSMVAATASVVPPGLMARMLHLRQRFRFHRPARPGDELVSHARPIGYVGQPRGSALTLHAETRTGDGELLNEQWATSFFPRYDAGEAAGEQAVAEHRIEASVRQRRPIAEVVARVDDDQTFRYASASGDPTRIHLDEDMARLAGLPGIIVHGCCVMAFTSWALLTAVAGSRTDRLKGMAVSFAAPVRPGQDLATTIWASGSGSTYAYETKVGHEAALTNGWAHIAS